MICIMSSLVIRAQDNIIKRNGEEIKAKILEITPTMIKYKRTDYLDGPIISVLKSDILMIRYKNGTKDIFYEEKQANQEKSKKNEKSVMVTYADGQRDAEKYYKKYSPSANATALTTLGCGGLFGLIPAIATSTTAPTIENLGMPDRKLINNSEYYMGYTSMAKKIKSRQVWKAYGISIFINIVLIVAIVASG